MCLMNTVNGFIRTKTVIEKRYKGRWSQSMLADYCWKFARDHPEEQHKRNAAKRTKYE